MAECSFEKDLEQLEKIVEALEEGGLSLDDSLKQFEQGIKLARRCEKTLSEAEKRIEVLTKKAGGELVAQPFEEEGVPAALEDSKPRASRRAVSVEETVVAEKRRTEIVEEVEDGDEDDEEGELLF